MSSHKCSYIFLLLLFTPVPHFVNARSTPVPPEETTTESQVAPEGRQGILEIPKQAATYIRNFLDSSIKNYFGLTTPETPSANVPPELKDSIVGNFLLGNLYGAVSTAAPFTPKLPSEQTEVKPIYVSNEPSYIGHSPTIKVVTQPPKRKQRRTTTSPPSVPSEETPAAPQVEELKEKQKVTPAVTGEKLHVLETDTSLTGIFNEFGSQVNEPKPPRTKKPPTSTEAPELKIEETVKPKPKPSYGSSSNSNTQFLQTDAFLSNPYGLLVGKEPDDEVYWIDPTRPSIVIPIQPSTTPRLPETTAESEQQTEAITVETTTEEEEEEGIEEEDALTKII